MANEDSVALLWSIWYHWIGDQGEQRM